ncbi:MAG: hypothetical protein KAS32_19460 [Candidatus Peribacteraceae bacterium]|nr:hypothetical protein [Candidatus Peribacteraceae bacterium]
MTFYPSKKRQKEWIKRYLNKGVVYEDGWKQEEMTMNVTACHDAMLWLADNEIVDLADAWDKCERCDWLGWMYARMNPSKTDLKKCFSLIKNPDRWFKMKVKRALDSGICHEWAVEDCLDRLTLKEIRDKIPNPWLPKSKKKIKKG